MEVIIYRIDLICEVCKRNNSDNHCVRGSDSGSYGRPVQYSSDFSPKERVLTAELMSDQLL